jgi:hypothetical protein
MNADRHGVVSNLALVHPIALRPSTAFLDRRCKNVDDAPSRTMTQEGWCVARLIRLFRLRALASRTQRGYPPQSHLSASALPIVETVASRKDLPTAP